MAQKMIDDILAAEAEGKQTVRQAEERAQSILNDADVQAAQLILTAKQNAEAEGTALLQSMNNDSAALAAQSRSETVQLQKTLSEQAAKNRDRAIERVISLLG